MATAPTPPGLGARSAGLNAHYGLGAPPKPAPVRTPRPKQTGAAALPTDPLQPLSGAQIANTIAGYTAGTLPGSAEPKAGDPGEGFDAL